jgi:hypothetical protein
MDMIVRLLDLQIKMTSPVAYVPLADDMPESQHRQGIPASLSDGQFERFVLPHLTHGRPGPAPSPTNYLR